MPAPNYGTAALQTALQLQKVNDDVALMQNLDKAADQMFSDIGEDDIGEQAYRHPVQTEVGGITGYYQPDGGTYMQGNGPQYDQFIVAPQPLLHVVAATELARRIASGGKDITVVNWTAKLITQVKDKLAHVRNAYLQGYNNGILATIDPSYVAGSTTVPFVNVPFGARLLDRGGQYQVVDANLNVIGVVNVQSVQNKSIGGIDTVVIDAAPANMAAGYSFIPVGLATGAPQAINGLNYIVNPSPLLEYCGVARANEYVQAPAYNAGGAFLTLGILEAFKSRKMQSLGVEQFAQGNGGQWYGHQAHQMSANIQGFAKSTNMLTNGTQPTQGYDIGISMAATFRIGGETVTIDSMAAIDKLYWLVKSNLKRIRYPGSQKFIPGPVEGMFWPRLSGGLWTSESDVLYQDSLQYYSSAPEKNGVIYNLGIQPALAVANS